MLYVKSNIFYTLEQKLFKNRLRNKAKIRKMLFVTSIGPVNQKFGINVAQQYSF